MTTNQRTGKRAAAKAATRAKLIEAARACFEAHGYADTQVGQISRAAGCAHGTFYVHFANKEEVLDELLNETNQSLRAGLAPVLVSPAPLPTRVRKAANVFLDFCDDNRPFVECYAQRLGRGANLEMLRDGINPEVRGLLEGLIPRGDGTGADFHLVVHGLLAMWIRIGLQYLFDEQVTDRDRVVETLTALTVGGVVAAAEV